MTKPDPWKQDLLRREAAVSKAIFALELEWPQTRLDELNMTEQGRALVSTFERDKAALQAVAANIGAMLAAPEGFAALFKLSQFNRKAFDAIVILAQIELDRKPSEVAA